MFTGLPEPDQDSLVIYFCGPGFGECQVLAFPDGRWMVVDACRFEDQSMPLILLQHFGVTKVDLLAITHPDLDHISGLLDVLEQMDVVRVWRYPNMTLICELLTRMLSADNHKGSAAREQLARILEHIDVLSRSNQAFDISYGTRDWPDGANYQVSALAPTPHDMDRLRKRFRQIVQWKGPQSPELAQQIVDTLTGARSGFLDHGNTTSLALVLDYAGHRILLGGDVENGARDEHSGWSGILRLLEEDNRLALVTDLAAAKDAHHGSRNAFCIDAWEIHSKSHPVPLAVIAPFNRGTNPPPHDETLIDLGRYAEALLLTAGSATVHTRAVEAGWHLVEQGRQSICPVGALRLTWTETPAFSCYGDASVYRSPHHVEPQTTP